jgi:hypothetical protein
MVEVETQLNPDSLVVVCQLKDTANYTRLILITLELGFIIDSGETNILVLVVEDLTIMVLPVVMMETLPSLLYLEFQLDQELEEMLVLTELLLV